MAVVERVEIPVRAGAEAEFEAVLPVALPILRAAAGCRSISAARGVERPDTFLLLVTWDSVEDHVAFTKTAEFGEFVGQVKGFFAGPTNPEHFTVALEL